MKRESTTLAQRDWDKLSQIAKDNGCIFNNKPSWRTLLREIAQGKLKVVASDDYSMEWDERAETGDLAEIWETGPK